MNPDIIKKVVEAALLASGQALNIDRIMSLFAEGDFQPEKKDIRAALDAIAEDCKDRGIELREVASGFRLQVREDMAPWISRLWEEKPQRYTRALLETLALIAYRQPVTRGEIENVRGVAVSSNIIKSLTEREWIKVVGHRDVPGKPAMYGTTREFLDYFNLKSLDELPTLAELRDFESINAELDLQLPGMEMPGEPDAPHAQAVDAGAEVGADKVESETVADVAADEIVAAEQDNTETEYASEEDEINSTAQ
ncbi:SMC-Scp complex subunit ScpB [Sulfuriflexus mobilis]|uniref:SMC-Scp complex subunit ScpB n=1 Tax=Sulfuriflexus mobilis TaxID=1811807 RepID=UPI000F81F67F|nr:SMC-Scp complex subunit ScpB [Sulfuriflexus mobilis]